MVLSDAITFREVTFVADGQTILHHITGHFPNNKVTCLIGPSGSGKTTLLKLCNGLLSPTQGEIFIQGKNIRDIPPVELRRTVGIALQHAPMVAGTVFDNLSLPLQLQNKKLSVHEAGEFLDDVGLDKGMLQQNAKGLSGGQKQRVAIARTLVNKTKILLLDEITASLDREAAAEIERLMLKINEKYKVTTIWITHNIHQAKRVADFFWMLADGKVVEIGPATALQSPTNEHVKRFIEGESI